jgi:hypothetical protein
MSQQPAGKSARILGPQEKFTLFYPIGQKCEIARLGLYVLSIALETNGQNS